MRMLIDKLGLRAWIPPALPGLLRGQVRSRNKCMGRFGSYEAALSACRTEGYENRDLIDLIQAKGRILADRYRNGGPPELSELDSRAMLGIGLAGRSSSLNIVDFGGGLGVHYHIARRIFGSRLKFNWCVVETPETVSRGAEFQNDELRFFSDVGSARAHLGRIDLLFSSGALQYLPDPLAMVREFAAADPDRIYLTRWGLTEGFGRVITVQQSYYSENGCLPGLPEGFADKPARYPLVLLDRREAMEQVGRSFEIVFQGMERAGAYRPPGARADYYGVFGRRPGLAD